MITLNNRKLCENCFAETTLEPCPHCGFSKAAYRQDPITLAVGSVLNQRYMIGGVIGKGGFGITYLAYDLKLDARLAVKEYYPMGLAIRNPGSTLVSVSNEESEDSFRTGAEKFYSEAKMVAKFNGNPNIVSVHDFFYENDTVYFTMGYLQGETLKSYLKRKKISEGQAVSIFHSISGALMAAHSLKILHRDISPDNIMLCDDGTIRLLDFGAARQVMAEQSQSLSVILKQGFAPLEQYQKKGKQGPWTDIYALGATIYTALTGDMLNDPMTRLEDDSEFTANSHGISEGLWGIIQKCTQLKIQDRYQDIGELKNDLNSIGIESEAFTDIEEEIKEVLRKAAKPFGSTRGTGIPGVDFAPSADPNATMLLGSANSDHRTMSMDDNATVYLGSQGGGASNETVAMSPEEAAAYTDGKIAESEKEKSDSSQPPEGRTNMTAPPQERINQQGQGQPESSRKSLPVPAIIIPIIIGIAILIVVFFFAIGMLWKNIKKTSSEPTETTTENSSDKDGTGNVTGSEADALKALGENDIEKYENDTYKYSICYPAGYSLSDADDKTVEIADESGTLHVAVRYMDRYIDDSILYDADDFSNMIDARAENLLPVEGSGSTPKVEDNSKSDVAGQENIINVKYNYKDKKKKTWDGNVYLFDSEGQYGCYVVYTLIYEKADDYDELQEYASACVDSFRITDAYDPPAVDIYEFEEYGIKFSVNDGVEAFTKDSDDAEGTIHVKYKASNGKNRVAFVIPAEHLGEDYEDIFIGTRDCLSSSTIDIVSDMIPIDFGEYSGYWVKAEVTDSNGDSEDGRIYVFKANDGSDSKYQSYAVLGSAADDDKLRDIVGGFRFEGSESSDNSEIDTSDTVAFSDIKTDSGATTTSEPEYIFPGSDTRELSNSDIDIFLNDYLERNNATNASERDRKRICARGLCYARNEIYARHGYIFNSSELRDLFNSMSWYYGTIPSDRFSNDMLNSAEKKNVEFLKKKMEDYGGYQPAK